MKLYDTGIKKKTSLPDTFSRMVLHNGQLQTVNQIQQRHALPQPLAYFYCESGPFFNKLRDFRVNIVHHGVGTGPIFQTPRGFAVDTTRQPFSSFNVWKEEDLLPNRLGSLRVLTTHIIAETLAMCEAFAITMQETFELPPDIAPGYRLFLRGYHIKSLLKLNTVLESEPWWK